MVVLWRRYVLKSEALNLCVYGRLHLFVGTLFLIEINIKYSNRINSKSKMRWVKIYLNCTAMPLFVCRLDGFRGRWDV